MAWRSLSILKLCLGLGLKSLISWLMLGLCLSVSALGQTQSSSAGKTIMAQGDVNALSEQQARTLARRSPVYTTDLVTTGQQSATQLRMVDGALLSMQASSELSIASYEFDTQTEQGSVNMSLLKGGLKTVTGALQQRPDNYKLMTPVASIGVRGTHYEAELVEGDLYLAAWKGIIDINVTAGTQAQQFSLGPLMPYKFAIVRADGSVEFLIQTPSAFSSGYSRDFYEQVPTELMDIESMVGLMGSTAEYPDADSLAKFNSQTYMDNDRLVASWLPASASRQGLVVFAQLEQHSISSSLGDISDFTMSMSINFDSARIPSGSLSFLDQGGEWFAAFDGIIRDSVLDLSVNFAAHGNKLASGSIDALLIDQARGVLGNIALQELSAGGPQASGSFVLRQINP